MTRDHVIAYNVDNYRKDQDRLAREIHAILDTGPLLFFAIECRGNRLPAVRGYDRLLHKHDESLSQMRNAARYNTITYVREGADRTELRWIDLGTTWPRTKGPGTHEPRSFPWLVVEGLQGIGVHQQPKRTATTIDGQAEGIGALARAMGRGAEDRPAVALGDFNRRKFEPGPGPATLAKRIGGKALGNRIDCAVTNTHVVGKATYLSKVGGVPLLSDHPHALRLDLKW